MTRRSEHGGGEAAINRANHEAQEYNEWKRNRKIGQTAMYDSEGNYFDKESLHEIDRIIAEEDARCQLNRLEERVEVIEPDVFWDKDHLEFD